MVAAIQYLNCVGCYNRLLKMRFNLISISSFFIDREGINLEYSVMNTYNWYYYLIYYMYMNSNCFPCFVHDFLYHETVYLFPVHRINCCLIQASLFVIFERLGGQDVVYQTTHTRFERSKQNYVCRIYKVVMVIKHLFHGFLWNSQLVVPPVSGEALGNSFPGLLPLPPRANSLIVPLQAME